MALIKCSECGKEISDKATACPGCGCPNTIVLDTCAYGQNNITTEQPIKESVNIYSYDTDTPVSDSTNNQSDKIKYVAIFCLIIAAVFSYNIYFSATSKIKKAVAGQEQNVKKVKVSTTYTNNVYAIDVTYYKGQNSPVIMDGDPTMSGLAKINKNGKPCYILSYEINDFTVGRLNRYCE